MSESATEAPRRLLDERGVEWYEPTTKPNTTWFPDSFGINCRVKPWGEVLQVKRYGLTPEQAIAATLGGGKLTAEQVRGVLLLHLPHREYYSVEQTNAWQAIADELNATLGGVECEVECFDDGVDESMDGEWVSYAPPTWYLSCGHEVQGIERPNYCVVCGRAVRR